MPLILPGNVASATAAAYEVANSCRFDDGDSPKMVKQVGTPSSQQTFTLSTWFKLGNVTTGANRVLFCFDQDSNDLLTLYLHSTKDQLALYSEVAGSAPFYQLSNALIRDPSAWYHVAAIIDGTDGTQADRLKIYLNGTRITSWATDTQWSSVANIAALASGNDIIVGAGQVGSASIALHWEGYLAETIYLDGTAAAIGDLGEFDSDSPTIWKPKDVSGLTFGNNGFYCDYEASANLGNDANGGTDLTETNLAAVDQATDTPTNNFCTLNPISLQPTNTPTLAQGNCRFSGTAAGEYGVIGTMGVSSGKWYFEMKKVSQDSGPDDDSQRNVFGITAKPHGILAGKYTDPESWMLLGNSVISNNNVEIASVGASMLSDGGILQCALDLDNNRVAFGHDNAWQTGSSAFSGSYSDYESITAAASTISGFYFPVIGDNSGSRGYTMDANFGGCPAMAISSAAADENGYGAFEFAPPSGFLALCTKNLAEEG